MEELIACWTSSKSFVKVLQQWQTVLLPFTVEEYVIPYISKSNFYTIMNDSIKNLTASKNITTYAFWYLLHPIIFFPTEKLLLLSPRLVLLTTIAIVGIDSSFNNVLLRRLYMARAIKVNARWDVELSSFINIVWVWICELNPALGNKCSSIYMRFSEVAM